jgi:NADPH-dependent glutamate synthase beta subunit-like oxidoreductase
VILVTWLTPAYARMVPPGFCSFYLNPAARQRLKLHVRMSSSSKRVAVIGAGISGIATAAHLKKEGIEVTVFERSNAAGGIW